MSGPLLDNPESFFKHLTEIFKERGIRTGATLSIISGDRELELHSNYGLDVVDKTSKSGRKIIKRYVWQPKTKRLGSQEVCQVMEDEGRRDLLHSEFILLVLAEIDQLAV
jgi:hypothetical protein